ncbi:MAG: hypothetical protein GY953_24375, partial [bacterium]|nr:hypothetical protein [bacterium]
MLSALAAEGILRRHGTSYELHRPREAPPALASDGLFGLAEVLQSDTPQAPERFEAIYHEALAGAGERVGRELAVRFSRELAGPVVDFGSGAGGYAYALLSTSAGTS